MRILYWQIFILPINFTYYKEQQMQNKRTLVNERTDHEHMVAINHC